MKNIILGVTASIAAYKACDLISRLKKKKNNIICVMTAYAEEFITPLTLEALSGNKVYRDMFKLPDKREIIHVSLAEKADLVLICPATANIIGKLAGGICDDLLTALVISSKAPILIAPAMNENMYKHDFVQENIRKLERAGFEFVGPIRGDLACGSSGMGHIAGLEQIINKVDKILAKI